MVIVWLMMVNNNLIGGIPIPLKNMTSVGMMTFPTEWKNKNCSKPPTSLHTPTFHREKPWFSCRWLVADDVPLMDMTGSNMFQICSFIPYDLPWFPAGETKGWESQKSCCQMMAVSYFPRNMSGFGNFGVSAFLHFLPVDWETKRNRG